MQVVLLTLWTWLQASMFWGPSASGTGQAALAPAHSLVHAWVLPAPCRCQRELASGTAQLAADRESLRREREALERRAESLQQVSLHDGNDGEVTPHGQGRLLLWGT